MIRGRSKARQESSQYQGQAVDAGSSSEGEDRPAQGPEKTTSEPASPAAAPHVVSGGKHSSLYRALEKPFEYRSQKDITEIVSAVETIHDPFIQKLEPSMKHAMCNRFTMKEYAANETIFNYGDIGETLHVIWSGKVAVWVPRNGSKETVNPPLEKVANLEPGKVFGELALLSDDNKRHATCIAVKETELLCLSVEDYRWCVGYSQASFVQERVTFLQSCERCMFEGISQVDLQAMAGCLQEVSYKAAEEILRQGSEVEKVFFVKSGFCKLTRQLHPRFRDSFDHFADKSGAPQNPLLPDSDSSQVSSTELGGLGFRQALQKLLRKDNFGDEVSEQSQTPKSSTSSSGTSSVQVGMLRSGHVFGVMEMLEGLTYQCTVHADPWTDLYVITKFDLLRNTSKGILHKLFCDYKPRLSDERLMQRLKQLSRWNGYKRELLDEIRNKTRPPRLGIIDRRDPPPRRVGVSGLPEEDLVRVGHGEKLWDQRAQTPTKAPYLTESKKEEMPIFHVRCVKTADGKPDVLVEREVRESSMHVLDEKIMVTIATARFRDKLRRSRDKAPSDSTSPPRSADPQGVEERASVAKGQALPQIRDKSSPSKSGQRSARTPRKDARNNAVSKTEDLEEQAKKAAEDYLQQKQGRIEELRMKAQEKAMRTSQNASPPKRGSVLPEHRSSLAGLVGKRGSVSSSRGSVVGLIGKRGSVQLDPRGPSVGPDRRAAGPVPRSRE